MIPPYGNIQTDYTQNISWMKKEICRASKMVFCHFLQVVSIVYILQSNIENKTNIDAKNLNLTAKCIFSPSRASSVSRWIFGPNGTVPLRICYSAQIYDWTAAWCTTFNRNRSWKTNIKPSVALQSDSKKEALKLWMKKLWFRKKFYQMNIF